MTMSITMQDLREMAVYPYRPEQGAFSPEELARQERLIERAKFYDRTADEAAEKGEAETARALRELAFYSMYAVARQYFYSFDAEQRPWYCLVAARLALAAGISAYAQVCCEAGLLQPDEEYEDAFRDLLERAREENNRGAIS